MQKYICDKCGADMGTKVDYYVGVEFDIEDDYESYEVRQLCAACHRLLGLLCRRFITDFLESGD